MDCPKCAGTLEEIYVTPGVLVDVCRNCKGTWLDQGEVLHFTPSKAAFAEHLQGALRTTRPTKFRCPRCAGAFEEIDVEALALDHCTKCKGLWFDAHELEALSGSSLVRLNHKAGRSAPGAEPQSQAGAASAGDVPGGMGAPALTFAAPSLPNLGLRAGGLLMFLFGMVGLVVIVAVEAGAPLELTVAIGIGVIVLQYLIGPLWLDFFLRRAQSLRWVEPGELPKHLLAFTDRVCAAQALRRPRFGIIDDGSPNAFTYGHHPGNARLVLTRGVIELLDEAELESVVGHELGHVKHWDVVVMTIAGIVPLVLYYVYRMLINVRGKAAGQARLIAVGAYLLYIFAQYLVLWLSRTREYHADRFSAEVAQNPNALASALVKIAYGLAGRAAAVSGAAATTTGVTAQARQAPAQAAGGRAFQSFGIFDTKAAAALTATSSSRGQFSPDNMLSAMQWDLWNPWASYFELHSTHPLPAKRLVQLAAQSWKIGQKPLVMFDRQKPESFWDEFLVDFFISFLPFLLALAAAAGVLTQHEALGLRGEPGESLAGVALVGYGVGYLVRTWFSYHSHDHGHPTFTVAGLLKRVKVSPVRGIACTIKGKIIGRGVPGLIWSDDLVLQDETGFIFLDYTQPLSLFEFIFGLRRAKDIVGQEATVTGWYRRGPVPYIEMLDITTPAGSHRCYTRPFKRVFGVLLVAGGLWLAVTAFL